MDIKLVDFGIFGSNRGNLPEKSNVGSLKYMPPEVLIGHNESTPKIDVWSLGCVLFGMITGKLPYRSSVKEDLKRMIIEQPIVINKKDHPDISDHCRDLIEKMLDKDPNRRIGIREIFEHPWIRLYKQEK